jgi:hypothetical protein
MAGGKKAAEKCEVIQVKLAVIAEQGENTNLWATAILIHWDLQLQRLIPPHLNDIADPKFDLFSRYFLLGIAPGIINSAIFAHQGVAVLKRLNPP